MAEFKKISLEEASAMFDQSRRSKAVGERTRIRELYRSYLEPLAVGEGGELTPGEGETKELVRGRLKRAARDLGMTLEYKRSRDSIVRFRVVSR